jgi:hypothetical protein
VSRVERMIIASDGRWINWSPREIDADLVKAPTRSKSRYDAPSGSGRRRQSRVTRRMVGTILDEIEQLIARFHGQDTRKLAKPDNSIKPGVIDLLEEHAADPRVLDFLRPGWSTLAAELFRSDHRQCSAGRRAFTSTCNI